MNIMHRQKQVIKEIHAYFHQLYTDRKIILNSFCTSSDVAVRKLNSAHDGNNT